MLCFQFSDTRDQIAGVEALLFAMSGGAVIGAGFPFENWRVRVAMNSTEILSERGHLVLGLMRRSGMEVVPHLWDKDMGEYDCWLLRRLDSRLNIEDEACVAAWIASGIPSHELMYHSAPPPTFIYLLFLNIYSIYISTFTQYAYTFIQYVFTYYIYTETMLII